MGLTLNLLNISIFAIPLVISFNYFLIFYIINLANNKKNSIVRLFIASLFVFILLSIVYIALGHFTDYLDRIEHSTIQNLFTFGIPILVITLISKLILNFKILVSLVLGLLYFLVYSLSFIPFFLTIACIDSIDPDCGKSYMIGVMLIFLILYFSLFTFLYLRERKSLNRTK
jgi:hypothetical protein